MTTPARCCRCNGTGETVESTKNGCVRCAKCARVKRKRCTGCRRLVGTYSTGTLRPHTKPNGKWCPVYGVRLRVADVRPLVEKHGSVEAARRLGTSSSTLRRRYGSKPWWRGRSHLWRYSHEGHAPGQGYRSECDGCQQRRRARYLASPEGRARAARNAIRVERRRQAAVLADADRAALEADRAYVAEMVASGRALNMRRALGIATSTVEKHIGLGHTALNKIENGRRPAMTRVKGHCRRYAALLRTWEDECARRGIDPAAPQPKINRRRRATQRAA